MNTGSKPDSQQANVFEMEISTNAKLVLLYLKGLTQTGKRKLPHPSNVAQLLKIPRDIVMASFRELVAKGQVVGSKDDYSLRDNAARYSLLTSLTRIKAAETIEDSPYRSLSLLKEFKQLHAEHLGREAHAAERPRELAIARGILKDFAPVDVQLLLREFFVQKAYERYWTHEVGRKPHVRIARFRNFIETKIGAKSINQ